MNRIKYCELCGTKFEVPYKMKGIKVYCSKECANKANKEQKKISRRINYARYYRNKVCCVICGKRVCNEVGHKRNAHDECVWKECLEAKRKHIPLTSLQYNRLRQRGWKVADLTDYIRAESNHTDNNDEY